MYLFFDTETNGLPKNWKASVTNLSNWPRLVQIAWVLYDDSGKLLGRNNHIIKPKGFNIPFSSSKIHGITKSELHVKLFGFDFEKAHNAVADINATAKCFWELKTRKLI